MLMMPPKKKADLEEEDDDDEDDMMASCLFPGFIAFAIWGPIVPPGFDEDCKCPSKTSIMGNCNASAVVAQCEGGLWGNCPTLEATALSKGHMRPESGPTALNVYKALPITTLTIR